MKQKNSYQLLHNVDIYYFSLDDSGSERERLFQFLDEAEKQRAARYKFDIHRFRFISGRGKLREVLARVVKCQPEEVIFGSGEFGKPYIKQTDKSNNIQFNVSKSSAMGAVAISQGMQIGLDIEQIKHNGISDCDLIVEKEFTDDEIKWYQQHDSKNRLIAFYALWTCKEAYLKALGSGLNDSLDRFTVSLKEEQPNISNTELESVISSAFSLYQDKISDDYIVCLATKKPCQVRSIFI